MLKALFDRIQETARPQIVEDEVHRFVVRGDGTYRELLPDLTHPDTLTLHSLDALVKMVQSEALEEEFPLYIEVPSPTLVHCYGQPNPMLRDMRQVYYDVNATDVPGWEPDKLMSFEEAQIALQTRFEASDDRVYCLKLLSDITMGGKVTFNDNGIATTVVTQKGVALQDSTTIRPIVTLRPYRTFQEVEQPDGLFLIRVSERGIRLVEADGGMWRLRARETVRDWLAGCMAQEVADGRVIIAL